MTVTDPISAEILKATREGWTVESHEQTFAVLTRGRVNHVLHLLLTVLTLGGWAIVWIWLSVTYPQRIMVEVAPNGAVTQTLLSRNYNFVTGLRRK